MTEKGKRIEEVMKYFNLNKNSFSKEIGLSSNVTIGRILKEERNPHPATLGKIVARFPQIDYEWLLSGKGKMLKNELKKETQAVKPSALSETDFSKIADACQRAVAMSETLAVSNAKLVEQLTESLARIEEKIDKKGALPESGSVLRSKRK